MKKTPQAFNKPTALRLKGAVLLGVAYVLGSLAIDTGSWWQYLGCLVFVAWGINSLVCSFTSYGKK